MIRVVHLDVDRVEWRSDRPVIQIGLFDQMIPVNKTVDPREAPRLSKQSAEILARLQDGNVTNVELARIGIRYSARIGELRAAGYRIEIIERNTETGVNVYRLIQ